MDHIAIMKKEWGLTKKILIGEKTVESRWYKNRSVPWNKIKAGEKIYFKDSGENISIRALVTKVEQYKIENNPQAFKIMQRYSKDDLGSDEIPDPVKKYITDKKYALFVYFEKVEKIEPFKIDKTGFGTQSAWITVGDVNKIRIAI